MSSTVLLGLLFAGYFFYFDQRMNDEPRALQAHEVPQRIEEKAEESFSFGGIAEVPPGGEMQFQIFDEHTGRPTDFIKFTDWRKVPGEKNEIEVTSPTLKMLLPSGMTAIISADSGRLSADRVEKDRAQPKVGRLDGRAKIIIDRNTSADRGPIEDRPEDLITITMDWLAFDLEHGTMQTDAPMSATSVDFEIHGVGVDLEWNQGENKLERLIIPKGDRFVLYTRVGLEDPKAQTQPAGEPARDDSRRRKPREPIAYLCTIGGGINATQYADGQAVGGLDGEQIEVLFDAGGKSDPFFGGSRKRERREADPKNRLEVKWGGSLTLGPTLTPRKNNVQRRRFDACGEPMLVMRGDTTIACGRIEYQDDTQQAWIYPAADGRVEMSAGRRFAASAGTVYVDNAKGVIKLLGDVALRSGDERKGQSIRAKQWAELRLAKRDRDAGSLIGGDVLASEQLESAVFVGDVDVSLGQGRRLRSAQLDLRFKSVPRENDAAAGTAGGELRDATSETGLVLDHAVASGAVRLDTLDESLMSDQLTLDFRVNVFGDTQPTRFEALGSVLMVQGRTRVSGRRIEAELWWMDEDPDADPIPQTVTVSGRARLIDPRNRVNVRGEQVVAAFARSGQLAGARVIGPADKFATVGAFPYRVRGHEITLDQTTLSLNVVGPSSLVFESSRGLQGQALGGSEKVQVTASKSLMIDGRSNANTIRFEGDVVAGTPEEQLSADILTLQLRDVPTPPNDPDAAVRKNSLVNQSPMIAVIGWLASPQTWREIMPEQTRKRSKVAQAGVVALPTKEPVKIVAENAVVESRSRAGDGAVSATLYAPQRLDIDIPGRTIKTRGETTLGLINRRGIDEPRLASDSVGVPSALVSRGPSQTAVRCTHGLTYAIGAKSDDGPRRDSALFEGAVQFRHRAGKDMVGFEEMLPASSDPNHKEKITGRTSRLDSERLECEFVADDGTRREAGGITGTPLRLSTLIASGDVFLRDVQGTETREMNSDRLEFDREQNRIRVMGPVIDGMRIDARIYAENTTTRQILGPFASPEFIIDLRDNTIQTGAVQGTIRR